jgi:hypothetical protein
MCLLIVDCWWAVHWLIVKWLDNSVWRLLWIVDDNNVCRCIVGFIDLTGVVSSLFFLVPDDDSDNNNQSDNTSNDSSSNWTDTDSSYGTTSIWILGRRSPIVGILELAFAGRGGTVSIWLAASWAAVSRKSIALKVIITRIGILSGGVRIRVAKILPGAVRERVSAVSEQGATARSAVLCCGIAHKVITAHFFVWGSFFEMV